jgi:hypothetical protein
MRLIPFILFVILFSSCGKNTGHKDLHNLPADSIIPREEMIRMLADVHTVEMALMFERNRGQDPQPMSVFYYKKLFSKYRMSRDRFTRNLAYYRDDPEELIKMYEEVVDLLDKRAKAYKSE